MNKHFLLLNGNFLCRYSSAKADVGFRQKFSEFFALVEVVVAALGLHASERNLDIKCGALVLLAIKPH